QLDDFIDGIF
nr:Chain B, Cell division protein FtsZ [Methanobrevibacter smithii DSM 2375]